MIAYCGVVERLRLDARSREAVEDRTARRIGRAQPVEEDADDGVVGDELAAAHEAIGLATERRARGDGRPQEVPRGEHGHAEMAGEDGRLGSLPRSGRPEENDDRHGTRRGSRSSARAGRADGTAEAVRTVRLIG